jgi:CO/xanthine dehydrogenase FAD-binding subunit
MSRDAVPRLEAVLAVVPDLGVAGVAAAEPAGELVTAVRLPAEPDASAYLRAGERQAFSFALVSVAACRRGASVRLVAAGVANVPTELDVADPLAGLPGNPQTGWKRDLLAALVERALAAVA